MTAGSHHMFSILLATAACPANSETVIKVYLDQKNNVHMMTNHGKHQQLTNKGNSASLTLAPDKETVAWLVLNSWKESGDERPGSEKLVIYRKGKYTYIHCAPFIRNYWFWSGGGQVAIDCGGRRFAGREILFDVKTLKEVSSFSQAEVPLEERPDWSREQD